MPEAETSAARPASCRLHGQNQPLTHARVHGQLPVAQWARVAHLVEASLVGRVAAGGGVRTIGLKGYRTTDVH